MDEAVCLVDFFFFKQKTAYEIMPSLVGSEMCIRDRLWSSTVMPSRPSCKRCVMSICLLYTSDAADDLHCVDLGGRRIIKKTKTRKHDVQHGNARRVSPSGRPASHNH